MGSKITFCLLAFNFFLQIKFKAKSGQKFSFRINNVKIT